MDRGANSGGREDAMTTPKTQSTNEPARTGAVPTVSVESLAKAMQSGFADAAALPRKVMEANGETSAEILAFMGRRFRAQAEFWDGLAHCKDLNGVADIQRRFVETMTRDYGEEMNHLVAITEKNLRAVASAVGGEGDKRSAA